jgi:glutaredoxin
MKEITYFYLKGCPYCRKADVLIRKLIEESPEFAAIPVTKIEESENPKIAESYDYYYVPCLWIGQEKLHEGAPTKEQMRKVLERALEE